VIHPAPRPKKPAKKRHQWNSTIPASKVSSAPKVRPPKRKVAKRKIQKSSTRKAKNWKRAYGSAARVEWVKQQPCVFCGLTPCENAHIETGGMGRKAHYTKVVPMCATSSEMMPAGGKIWRVRIRIGCHKSYDTWARQSMQGQVDLDAAAAETERKWIAYSAGRKSA
jgi:hypothetical protein